jgi:NAD(P)H-hydrate repair Nnr-like enzyme with NAD(P)H-hydrate dehydratase domain
MSNFVLHGIVGALIATTPVKPEYALAMVITAAVGKELYDRKHGGKFDSRDVLATVAGAAPVLYLRWEW